MNGSIVSWLLFAISTISIFSDVATMASASAQCLGVDQRSLLVELRNTLVFNASESSKLVQWDQSADSWSGVTCEDGLVVGLDLSNESISGGIDDSSSLFRLEFLQNLNLAFNDFNSTAIPPALANLSHLAHLNLSNAGFTEQIPVEISRLKNLRTLDLSLIYCPGEPLLKFEKPNLGSVIGDLGELRELYLDGVNVSAEGSEWCDSLSSSVPKLEVLSMSCCSLYGPIDPSLMSLANLSVIQLDYNTLSSTIPQFLANFSSLKTLSLCDCDLHGEFPHEIFQVQTLQTLDLSSNELLQGSLPEFSENGSLQTLVLSDTNVSGRLPDSIGNLKNLSRIELVNCNFHGNIPSSFANLSRLSNLDFSSNNFTGPIPHEIFQVQTLQTLDLSRNKLLQGSLPEFSQNGSLQTLVLSYTNVSGRLPDSIGSLKNLSSIELMECSFHGNIPSSFANLSQLSYLDFSSNNFTGPIPSLSKSKNLIEVTLADNSLIGPIDSTQWESLSNLRYLHLGFNFLEGNIPSSLFTHPSIQRLYLSNNGFSLEKSYDAPSPMLQVLDLSNNNIEGELPMSIWEFRGLKDLSLSSNNFSGSFHINCIQKLSNLSSLDLSYNRFSIDATNTASQASSFPNLKSLYLASCQLTTLPQFLSNQSELIYLDLSDNYIQGYIPRWIWTLDRVNFSFNLFEDFETPLGNLTFGPRMIDLHSNKLRGNMPPLPSNIYYLDFSSNNIYSVIPDDLPSLAFLSISKNNFHASIPQSICKVGLQVLDLSHNHMNGTIPDCLMKLESLTVLNVRNNQLNGQIPQNIQRTCNLKILDISENLLQGQIPLSLANCTTLDFVNIGDNQIDGTFPCHLESISSLRVLVLRSNKLHGEIGCPHSRSSWQMLQIIDSSSNDFGGTLPASLVASWKAMKTNVDFDHLQYPTIGSQFSVPYYEVTMSVTLKDIRLELVKILTIFMSIDFSSNRLEGPIPYTLGDLKALHVVNLSHNAISGSIPPVLGNLGKLESLDLSGNYLNGTIPAQLANLNFLSLMNLSNNQLVGNIPTSGQFLTFSISSFEGNLGLCGLQVNKSCSITPNRTEEVDAHGDNDDSEKKWFYMGIPLGFVVGFWAFYGPLVIMRSWRLAYYRFWDKVLFKFSRP